MNTKKKILLCSGICFAVIVVAAWLFMLRLGGVKTGAYLMNYYKLTNESIVSFYVTNKKFPLPSDLDEIKVDKWFELKLFFEDKEIEKGAIYVDLSRGVFDKLLSTSGDSDFQIYYYKRGHFLEPIFNEEICLIETRNLRDALRKVK